MEEIFQTQVLFLNLILNPIEQKMSLVFPADTPDWFKRAVEVKTHSRFVKVADSEIHYLTWFDKASHRYSNVNNGLLFIHGGGAHANWWRFIAPFFKDDYRTAAIDLSGMGDSEGRDIYSPNIWAQEIDAVMKNGELGPRPFIVGHSFGGLMTMKYGALHGDELSGVVIVDSPVQDPEDQPLSKPKQSKKTGPIIHGDLPTALSRFRLMPEQPCDNQYITDFIAQTSLKPTAGGWTWKFDSKVMGSRRFGEPYNEELKTLKCRSALIYGEKSAIVSKRTATYMSSIMGKRAPIVEIPEAHHHVMLDQPLAFIAALRAILDGWSKGNK